MSSRWRSVLDRPEVYLDPSDQLSSKCLDAVTELFDLYKTSTGGPSAVCSTGPLTQLYTEGFDNDQIWEEIQLLNAPVLKYLRKTVRKITSENTPVLVHVAPSQEEEVVSFEQLDAGSAHGSDGGGGEDGEGVEAELVEQEPRDGLSRNGTSSEKRRTTAVDDMFFKLAEMEKFLEMQERETQDRRDEPDDSGEESSVDIDYFAELSSGEEGEAGEVGAAGYTEFFDPPSGGEGGAEVGVGSDEEREGGAGDDGTDSEDSVEDGVTVLHDEGGGSSQAVGEEDTSEVKKDGPMSRHEKQQRMMKHHIDLLEEENLSRKPWQMDGEVASKGRPLNSLLEEDLEFDHNSRPAPVITEETTRTLEDIIKQRIKDEAWDDVERRIKPIEKPYDYSRSRPLDQEKSKLSLAEVYEQEYVKQTQTLDMDKEDERHKEIKELMKTLFVKLDALSNFHFTPKPPRPEVKIVANVPAIQMEEVAPVATSDAALLAPEEIQAKLSRTEVGSTEKTVTDRKRERRQKKRQKRLQQAEMTQRAKVVGSLRPGLGNKYSKVALSKKLKQRQTDEVIDKSLKNSSKFFAMLQDEVRDQVTSQKKDHSTTAKPARSSTAHKFKL